MYPGQFETVDRSVWTEEPELVFAKSFDPSIVYAQVDGEKQ
jgi:hypothetical protein